MGRVFAGGSDRLDPDVRILNVVMRRFVMGALIADGVISAIVGAALLTVRVGGVQVPLGVIIAALLNVLLVWCALYWAPTPRWAAAPLWAFVVTAMVLVFGGPGGDIVFTGLSPVLLIVIAVLPAAWLLRRGIG